MVKLWHGREEVVLDLEVLSHARGEERSDGRVRAVSLLVRALLRLGLALAPLETYEVGHPPVAKQAGRDVGRVIRSVLGPVQVGLLVGDRKVRVLGGR